MKSALFLDIVIRKGAAVLKLLAGKNKTLPVRRNAFFIHGEAKLKEAVRIMNKLGK
jgi:hypothetical protein